MNIIYFLLILIVTPIIALSQIKQVDVLPGGGGVSQNADYISFGTFGQPFAGESFNSTYWNKEGFLNSQAATVPILTSTTVTSILPTSAVSGGNFTFNGNSPITGSGIIYSLNSDIEIGDLGVTAIYTNPLVETGSYPLPMSALLFGTTYYVRAFGLNEAGVGYGNEISFTTLEAIQAKRIVFTNIQQYQLSLKFTIGNGEARVVLCKPNNPISIEPLTNSVTYLGNNYLYRGSKVDNGSIVYKGIGNEVTVKGLSRGVLYFFRVFEYFGGAGTESYNQMTAEYNPVAKMTLRKDDYNTNFNDNETQTLSVYPNPSNDRLNLSLYFEDSKSIDVTVYDLNGNAVLHPFYSYPVIEGTTQLVMDIKNLQTGTYQILVNAGEEIVFESFTVVR